MDRIEKRSVRVAGVFETVFLGVLGILAWQDRKEMSVSKKFLFLAGIFAVLGRSLVVNREIALQEWGLSILPGLLLLGIGWLSRWQIGSGDGVVILVMGLWLGCRKTFIILLLGMFLCSIFCGALVVFRKAGRKTEVPFVPFLWIACLMGRFFI